MKISIGLSAEQLKTSVDILSNVLADEVTLYTKTRKFHWNVSGESFMELHKLFEHQYKEIEEIIDEVAERIGKLGSATMGTMTQFIEMTRLKESPDEYPVRMKMIEELLHDHETVIKAIREDVEKCDESGDAGTTDFLTAIMKQHETIAWTLRRYLK
ncbi:MAG: starvation-inducible DNA-binding protein [Bacteroidota bacterium]|jgi:starvation-inducible DNA-binding protein